MTVIIPALNEERSLPLVLNDLPDVGRVVVVDNGSTDDTAEAARGGGATVVEVPVPYRRRVGTSKISGTLSGTIKAGAKILYLIAKYGLFRPAALV